MTVAPFNQPDMTSQFGTTYKANIDGAVAVLARSGRAFAPRAQATPNMTIQLDAGYVFSGTSLTEVAAQNTATITAPVTNPRIDRVVIDAVTGVVSVITGTAAASPVAPAITAGKLPVARIALTVGMLTIQNSNITDERVLGVSVTGVLSPGNLPAASQSAQGAAELATEAEAIAGADAARVITPSLLGAILTSNLNPVIATGGYLSKVSTNLVLSRSTVGRHIFINGKNELIPSAGTAGLSASGIRGAAVVSNVLRASNVATLTFGSAHGYAVGDIICVYLNGTAQTNGGFCGNHVVASVPTSTTLTYANTAADVGSAASTTISAVPLYYIYAFMSGATLTLEASPTPPAVDSTYGHKIKTGAATRTLVGMAVSIAGAAWEDSETQVHVLSYFNRRRKSGKNGVGTDFTTTGTSAAERNTAHRVTFINWAEELVEMSGEYILFSSTTANMMVAFQNDIGNTHAHSAWASASAASFEENQAFRTEELMSEGFHMAAVQLWTSAGTMTIRGDVVGATERSDSRVQVMG